MTTLPPSLIPHPQPLIPPGATIGILGGGQLGRMLAMAAAELGYHVHVYCPEENCPASEVARQTTTAPYEDLAALERFAKSVDVVTYEFENIPLEPVQALAKWVTVRPDPSVLEKSQHRLLEKTTLRELGVATAPFAAVNSQQALEEAVQALGTPSILKTCRMGYDGKGQWLLRPADNGRWAVDGNDFPLSSDRCPPSTDLILEGFVDFRMEISVIVARDVKGNMACYCPGMNIHEHHILSETIVPAPISEGLAQKAEYIARTIAEGMELVGLMAVEMFVIDGQIILVNEVAPRPHNSGHWTIDACITSQFTQTIRAICGLPLGSTERLCEARMVNLIGDNINKWEYYAGMPNAKLHLYGKNEAREGRKMGHITELKPSDRS